MHGLLSLQSRAAPATQVPVWHFSVPLHRSLSAHDVLSGRLGWLHTPELHMSWVHGLVSAQLAQVPPPLPQALAEFPATQLLPFQHPVQQAPAWQLPPGQLPELRGVWVQLPLLQLSVVHGFPSSQLVQVFPEEPQAAAEVPAWQLAPFQHPVQQLPPRQAPPVPQVPPSLLAVWVQPDAVH